MARGSKPPREHPVTTQKKDELAAYGLTIYSLVLSEAELQCMVDTGCVPTTVLAHCKGLLAKAPWER